MEQHCGRKGQVEGGELLPDPVLGPVPRQEDGALFQGPRVREGITEAKRLQEVFVQVYRDHLN